MPVGEQVQGTRPICSIGRVLGCGRQSRETWPPLGEEPGAAPGDVGMQLSQLDFLRAAQKCWLAGLAQGSREFSTLAACGRYPPPFCRRGTEGQARGAAAVPHGLSQHSAYRVQAWRAAPLRLASSRAPRGKSVKQVLVVSALSPREEVRPQVRLLEATKPREAEPDPCSQPPCPLFSAKGTSRGRAQQRAGPCALREAFPGRFWSPGFRPAS